MLSGIWTHTVHEKTWCMRWKMFLIRSILCWPYGAKTLVPYSYIYERVHIFSLRYEYSTTCHILGFLCTSRTVPGYLLHLGKRIFTFPKRILTTFSCTLNVRTCTYSYLRCVFRPLYPPPPPPSFSISLLGFLSIQKRTNQSAKEKRT